MIHVTTSVMERVDSLAVPSLDRPRVRALAWRMLRFALVGYCLLGLASYAPTVDAKGHCDCPLCQLP